MAGGSIPPKTGDFRGGTPITLPHNFGNPVGSGETFGNPIPQNNTTLIGGNVVTWIPSPTHFGNQVSFTLQCVPQVIVVPRNSTGTSVVSLSDLLGTNSAALAHNGEPSGVTIAFSPTSISQGVTSTVTATVASTAKPGRYDISIVGTVSGANVEVAQLTVEVI